MFWRTFSRDGSEEFPETGTLISPPRPSKVYRTM